MANLCKFLGDHLNCGPADMSGYEEDVVEWDGADEVEEEPGPHVVPGDQLWVKDHLLAVVRLHYPCA